MADILIMALAIVFNLVGLTANVCFTGNHIGNYASANKWYQLRAVKP